MTDAERFDPERGSTLMERRAQRYQTPDVTAPDLATGVVGAELGTTVDRLQQAQEPQATEEATTPPGTREDTSLFDPVTETTERTAQAQQPTVDIASGLRDRADQLPSLFEGLETRTGTDSLLDSQSRSTADVGLAEDSLLGTRTVTGTTTLTDTDTVTTTETETPTTGGPGGGGTGRPPFDPPEGRPSTPGLPDLDFGGESDDDDRARFEQFGAGYEVEFLDPLRGSDGDSDSDSLPGLGNLL